MQINTARLQGGLGHFCPYINILKDLNSEMITIGSNTHISEHVGYRFQDILELLSEIGFRGYAVFERQIPDFFDL